MKGILTKLLAVFAGLGAFFSAVFFVLFKQAKSEKEINELKQDKADAVRREETTEAVRQAENAVHNSIAKQEAEDEELNQRVHSGDGLDSFNAGLDMLRKQAERGNKRNSSAGSSGA